MSAGFQFETVDWYCYCTLVELSTQTLPRLQNIVLVGGLSHGPHWCMCTPHDLRERERLMDGVFVFFIVLQC